MTLKNLRYFQRIARLGSIVEAAGEFGVPPSSLSRAMAQLQRDVDQPLFERSGRATKTTPQGAAFLERVDAALAAIDEAKAAADRAAGRTTLALGFMHSLGTSIVPSLLRTFVASRPATRLRLFQGATDWLLETKLASGEIDLAIAFAPKADPKFASRKICDVEFVLVVPPGHPLARRRAIDLAACRDETFVALKPAFGIRQVSDAIVAAAGFAPKLLCEVEEVDTLRGFVAAGLAIGLVPEYAAPAAGEAARVRISRPHASFELRLLWLRDRPLAATAKAFRSHLASCRDLLPAPAGARGDQS